MTQRPTHSLLSDTFCSKREYPTLLLFEMTMMDKVDYLDDEENENPIGVALVRLVDILLEIKAENQELDD